MRRVFCHSPGNGQKAAYLTAEKLRKEVRRRFLAGPKISIGVATCPEDATKAQSLIKRADVALYLAKNSGIDLVRVFTTPKRVCRIPIGN